LVILGNQHVLRVQDLQALQAEVPGNVFLIRGASSWLVTETMIAILEMLRDALRRGQVTKKVMLLMDSSPVHVQSRVWAAAKRLKMFLCFVPAGFTWFMQPLDVIVIRRFKAFLRTEYQSLQIEHQEASVTVIDVLRSVIRGIRKVLQGNCWADAFNQCGYSLDESTVKSSIRTMLGKAANPTLTTPTSIPSEADLKHILPRRKQYPLAILMWYLLPDPPIGSAHVPEHPAAEHDPAPYPQHVPGAHDVSHEVLPWSHRLRPRDALRHSVHTERSRSPPSHQPSGASSSQGPVPCPLWMQLRARSHRRAEGPARTARPRAVALPRPRKTESQWQDS